MTEPVPLDVLLAHPEFTSPALAPDGGGYAFLSAPDGPPELWVHLDHEPPRRLAAEPQRGVRSFTWTAGSESLIYEADPSGDENTVLFVVDVRDGRARRLTPASDVTATLVAHERCQPGTALVGMNRNDPARSDLYAIDLATGTEQLIAADPGYVCWLVDRSLSVRGGVLPTADGGWTFMVSEKPGAAPEPVLEIPAADAATTVPLGFGAGDCALYLITSAGRDTTQVQVLDIPGRTLTRLAGDDKYDLGDVLCDADDGRPLLATVPGQVPRVLPIGGFDVADVISRREAGRPCVVSADRRHRHWIVRCDRDDGPASFLRYDRATGETTRIGVDRPRLAEYELAPMRPFGVAARDGLRIPCYIVLPAGVPPRDLPAVLLVHGGPWSRVAWGYRAEAQWFASRGYACLMVNYRGSTGYGKDFTNAGDRQWGRKMQDDLIDALGHVVASGTVDPGRVAIYGASYGGYAALAAAAFTPDQFACAVDAFGPSDLVTLLRSFPPSWKPVLDFYHRRVGHPERDAAELRRYSPLGHHAQITMPLLVAQGGNDPRVPESESRRLVDAMRACGRQVEYLCFPDEGHGFDRPANRIAFYQSMERFLGTHIGGAEAA
jgi:dienelactone hydrolase